VILEKRLLDYLDGGLSQKSLGVAQRIDRSWEVLGAGGEGANGEAEDSVTKERIGDRIG
jgi:hypothetical protein